MIWIKSKYTFLCSRRQSCIVCLSRKHLSNGLSFYPDGRKPFPIVHGKTSEDTFLEVKCEYRTRTACFTRLIAVDLLQACFTLYFIPMSCRTPQRCAKCSWHETQWSSTSRLLPSPKLEACTCSFFMTLHLHSEDFRIQFYCQSFASADIFKKIVIFTK